MWIKKIKINNFRNYKEQEVTLNKNINIFYGENAQGKTNIIESIFLASIGKSFRAGKDIELIKFGEKMAQIEIDFEKSDRDGNIKINIENKKNIFINKIKIKKLSDLLGTVNTVIFTPDDINILKGGPQNRRKFLDIMISQLRPNYMHIYNLYKNTLDERNNYLKKIKLENAKEDLLEVWDEQLIQYAEIIAKYRKEFIEKIKNKIEKIHNNITGNKEKIKIEYITECLDKNNYKKLLNERRKLDIIKGYTTKGVHRDDFFIYLNDILVNIYGSQGQHRTAMLSLKIAELQVINDEIGENPILLLDDFMSELDENRRNNFMKNIKDTQVIITCTDKLLLKNIEGNIFKVEDGKIFSEI
jgi:DNA replication and repair protein RecF